MTGARPHTWMPIYIGDYLADTMHLSYAEHGAYLLLIFAYWRSGGPLPDDDRMLAGICKASAKQWRDLRPALVRFFQIEHGAWRHKRIETELENATAGYAKRRAAAMQRWDKASSKADAKHHAMHEQPHPQSQEEERDANASPKKEAKHGTRLPDDWRPDEQDREFAQALGLSVDGVAAKFIDHWRAKPGAAGRKLDWSATWRNWCRSDAERHGGGGAGRGGRVSERQGPPSLFAAASRVIARLEGGG